MRAVVPKTLRQMLMKGVHGGPFAGHFSGDRLYKTLVYVTSFSLHELLLYNNLIVQKNLICCRTFPIFFTLDTNVEWPFYNRTISTE